MILLTLVNKLTADLNSGSATERSEEINGPIADFEDGKAFLAPASSNADFELVSVVFQLE